MKDLLVVVADSNMKGLMEGLLPRIPIIEKLSAFTFDVRVHPMRDAGVRTQIVDFVYPDLDDYRFLLVLLDHEGSGFHGTAVELQSRIQGQLEAVGWAQRVCVVAIDPECDVWMWVNRNKMKEILKSLRGSSFPSDIDAWLTQKGFNFQGTKPERPKEALEALCREIRLPRSSSIYKDLASSASYRECSDPAFLRFWNFILEKFSTN